MPPVQPPFGEELRRRRLESGRTLRKLAELVHLSPSYLSKIERGERPANDELARLCDAALKAGGQLRALHSPRKRLPGHAPATEPGSLAAWTLQLRADGRSDFIAHDPASLTDGATPPAVLNWVVATTRSENVPPTETLPLFHTLFHEYRRLGQCSGPAVIAPMTISATAALRSMASSAPTGQRAAVLRLAARFAEYTGWMAQEAGDDPVAHWWTRQAASLATAGEDREMVAYTLVRQAELALYRGDSMTAVELCREAAAQARGRRTRELAAQREAQGHALMGDEDQCRCALDLSGELSGAPEGQDDGDPALGSTHLPDLMAFVRAWCLRELGEPESAVALLEGRHDAITPHALRARARHGARLALALVDAGAVDRACAIAESVARDVMTTDSATVRADMRQLQSSLARRRGHPAVRDILPVIAASLRDGSTPRAGYG